MRDSNMFGDGNYLIKNGRGDYESSGDFGNINIVTLVNKHCEDDNGFVCACENKSLGKYIYNHYDNNYDEAEDAEAIIIDIGPSCVEIRVYLYNQDHYISYIVDNCVGSLGCEEPIPLKDLGGFSFD